jgi:transposase
LAPVGAEGRTRRDVTLAPFCEKEPEELNVLKPHLRVTIQTLLRNGTSQREIERLTGVDRKTIRRYGRELGSPANSPGVATGSEPGKTAIFAVETPPPRPPAAAVQPARPPKEARSACEVHREWIQAQVELGRNAVSIYQDLVEAHGFTHRYNSVKRFVRTL